MVCDVSSVTTDTAPPRRRRGNLNKNIGATHHASAPSHDQPSSKHERLADSFEGGSRKHPFRPYHAIRVPKSANLQSGKCIEAAAEPAPTVTTVMLRNIPNKYTQASLLRELDSIGFAGRYDFFYLPMDVHNRTNVGYAFVNFLTPQDALRFSRTLTNYKFQQHSSQKIATVCPAHVQGLVRNLLHFSNRAVSQSRDMQYRPIVIRDGRYRDCVEVLNEMLADADMATPPRRQHSQKHKKPAVRSNLNPAAQIFVPQCEANDVAYVSPTSQPFLSEDEQIVDFPYADSADRCRLLGDFDPAPLVNRWWLQDQAAAEPDHDKEFENAVLSWLQDEDCKQERCADAFEMGSTDEGSLGSEHAMTPSSAGQSTSARSPQSIESFESSMKRLYFPLPSY